MTVESRGPLSTIIVVIVVATVLLTIAAVMLLVTSVVRSARSLGRDLVDLRERILPDLEQIQRDTAVSARELDQVGSSLDDLRRPLRGGRHDDPGSSVDHDRGRGDDQRTGPPGDR